MGDLFGRVLKDVKRLERQRISPLAFLFPQQLEAVTHPARFKVLFCGRRAGKTDAAIKASAAGMLEKGSFRGVYIGLTIASAREILWEPFKRLNDQHGWGLHFDSSKFIVTHPNGARLLVRGSDDVRELEKLRGPSFDLIMIDECGSHRPSYLRYLLEEVLEATLMDRGGSVWLMGTPTRQAFGYFYDATTGKEPGWTVFHWTAKSNPHVNFDAFVYEPKVGLLARRGWTEDHPIFRREYLAEWVAESVDLVFRFERTRNTVLELPKLRDGDRWLRVMSADFGVGDATAVGILTYPEKWGRDVYLEHAWSARGMAPSDAVDRIRATCTDYRPEFFVGDVNGLGKGYEREWNKRHAREAGLPMIAALKADKRAALEVVSDAFYTAKQGDVGERRGFFVLAHLDEPIRQFSTLLWDEDREDIAEGQDDDSAMMAVYGFRKTPAFANAADEPLPPPPHPYAGTALQGMVPARSQANVDDSLIGAFGVRSLRRYKRSS